MTSRKCWILSSRHNAAVFSSLPTLYAKYPELKAQQNIIYKAGGGKFTIEGKVYTLKRAPLFIR